MVPSSPSPSLHLKSKPQKLKKTNKYSNLKNTQELEVQAERETSTMESKTRLKQRLSRLFRPSAMLRTSCNSTTSGTIFSSSSATNASSRRSLSTATDNIIANDPVFIPHDSLFNTTRLLDRSRSFSSSSRLRSLDCRSCRPTKAASDVVTTTTTKAIDSKKKERRVIETGELYEIGEREGRTCPPASPSSPSVDYFCNFDEIVEQEAERKKKDKATINNKNKKKLLSNPYGFTSSSDDDNGSEFFGSDNEDETEAFFSSRSFSSDSSEFYKRPSSRKKNMNKNKDKKRSTTTTRSSSSSSRRRPPRRRMNFRPVVSAEEEERSGIPVMKRSSDPYVDFRNSMVEMIVERQIFGATDLERLLHSYLSLNSPSHHSVILGAFADIFQVLSGH